MSENSVPSKPRVAIHYCNLCRWVLRASWLAQELLFTFDDALGEVALCPGLRGGFDIYVDDELIWSRKEQGRFPEAKEIKQRIRDIIDPQRDLGHSDIQKNEL
ncbi:SelT/SelW/SelH family protein [Celerinatantimonas sp. YJH-8]|uniref:SelT/SelW/SelH family protein n=1 Tax=Celerinatantimonas sp. YJH-8 TaxID=3228714 RepID=UPI0038C50ADD